MPGFYLLTILNYFIVVPESGELPCTYYGMLKLKHRSAFFLRVKLASNIWFPHRESNPGCLGENQKSFFSKFIACCITCCRNGTGSFSLISPDVSFLNSKVSQYPAAPRGLVPSSLHKILLGIWIPAHAIAISVFMLDAVILSLPHYSLSLWKHFISISVVHNCTWCCTILHSLQYSVFTSFLPSFSIFPAPSVPSLHFKNACSFLS